MRHNIKLLSNKLTYCEALPHSSELKKYIANYWAILPPKDDTSENTVIVRMLPDGLMDIVFFLDSAKAESCWSTNDGRMIIGLREKPYMKTLESQAHRIGIRFLPGGALPFLQCTMTKFRGKLTALEAVWGKIAVDLEEQLHLDLTIAQKFALLEETLLKILIEQQSPDYHLKIALDLIYKANGLISIEKLADAAGTSARSLNRRFETWIGLNPKMLCRITRFRHTLISLKEAKFNNLTDLALSSGYYDQAHFSNDFRYFSGLTPQQAKILDSKKYPDKNFLRIFTELNRLY